MNKLKSKSDIDIDDMIRCANEFHIISQNDKTFIPNFAILAFACELYMKTILFYYTKNFPKGHDLERLYAEMSKHFNKSEFIKIFAEQRQKLYNDYDIENSERSLMETLRRNSNMFEDWRYLFEKKIDKPYTVHGFVFVLAEALRLYVDRFIGKEQK